VCVCVCVLLFDVSFRMIAAMNRMDRGWKRVSINSLFQMEY
jgi:hypothetical protein